MIHFTLFSFSILCGLLMLAGGAIGYLMGRNDR